MPIAPLRILYNEKNLLRTAALTPSSVIPAENTVLQTYVAKTGTGSVALTGAYTGAEDATVDLQILDATAVTTRASAPVLVGAGSGTMTGIAATGGFQAQDIVVSLKDAGIPIVSASIDFEGVKIVARNPGDDGNNIHIGIDQSALVFTTSGFSLLTALSSGQGSDASPLSGPEFDWDAAALGADGQIPLSAHRVAFGDDLTVYLQYKKYVSNNWQYFFVPALKRDIPIDTIIKFVTGGRTVTITDSTNSPATVETYVGIKTVYDLLSQIREGSALVTVDGIVANDRSPTGQAARDLLVRTDAHAEPSYGTGSQYAKGFEAIFVAPDASTERVLARCYATNGNDHPLAHLGRERWTVQSSLSGTLADAVTGVPYLTGKWGFTIPVRYPPGYGVTEHGKYSLVDIRYASRTAGEIEPPICVALSPLGPAAIDQTITLTLKAKPTDCICTGMPKPRFSLRCLGLGSSGGDDVAYTTQARTRLSNLAAFVNSSLAAYTRYTAGKVRDGIPEAVISSVTPGSSFAAAVTDRTGGSQATSVDAISSIEFGQDLALVDAKFADSGLPPEFSTVVGMYRSTIRIIDALDEVDFAADRTLGWNAWDAALQVLIDDLDPGSPATFARFFDLLVDKYQTILDAVLDTAGIAGESDASVLTSGDGCWQDYNDSVYWEVIGSVGGKYARAYTNHPYILSREGDSGKFFSTHEAGFEVQVKCPQYLKLGDQITLAIGNAAWPATYQTGDNEILPVLAAHDLYLAGGKDGDLTQTWNPVASIDGPLAPYVLDPGAPTLYDSGTGLTLQINQGGIAFKNGDEFRFSTEGGHFQYRVDGGSWIGPLDIPDGPLLLFDGLSAIFTGGNAPSFNADDAFGFQVLQPRRASNLQAPSVEVWKWGVDDIGPYMQFWLGSLLPIPNFAIALHTLPAGCTLAVHGAASLDSPWTPDWTEPLTRVEGPIFAEFTGRSAEWLRLYILDADGASIGWAFSGDPVTTSLTADLDPVAQDYSMKYGDGGLYQAGRYLGMAVSGTLTWTEGALSEADVAGLIALTNYSKKNRNQNFIVVPNNTRPQEAFMGHVATDRIEWPDLSRRQANANVARRFQMQLPVAGVYFQ